MKKIFITMLMLLCCFAMIYSGSIITNINAVADSYYSGTENLSGNSLLKKLAEITYANHTYYNTYGDTRNWGMYSDPDPKNSSNTLDFYSRISVKGAWDGGNSWNREHVWPQSQSGGLYSSTNNSTKGAGGDIHHIRPTIPSINSSRGNKLYTDFDKISATGSPKYHDNNVLVAYQNSQYWEPLDNVKGDAARILMYLYMHYSNENGLNSHSYAGNLRITNVVYGGGGADKAWDLLVYWNELDPVDDYESNRNEYCASKTGARNPFIDHPEFADIIWGDGGTVNPGTPTTYTVTYNTPDGTTFNYTDTKKYSFGDKISNPTVEPSISGYVFDGWYKDSNFTAKWDFTKDTISSNVTLYAKFNKNIEYTSFNEVFQNLKIKSQLTFDVEEEKKLVGSENKTININEFTNGNGVLGNKDHNLADYMKFDTNLFDISYNHNNASKSFISLTLKELRLYSGEGVGSSIEIKAKDGVKISEITCSEPKLKIEIAEDGKSAKIQNTLNSGEEYVVLKNFIINYTQELYDVDYKVDFNNLYIVYALQLKDNEFNLYKESGKTISMKVNGKNVIYYITKTNDGYQFTFRIKVTDLSTYYSPEFILDGLSIYINGYSAKTLASYYISNLENNTLVKKYNSCLEEILK